jgi:hypothetical protein
MRGASIIALGLGLGWAALPAFAQPVGSGIRPDPYQCLTASPLTDWLCFATRGDAAAESAAPSFEFVSINQYGDLTGDFGANDDVRDFTSEAMFSDSLLAGNLSEEQLRAVARVKPQWESYNRVSFRLFAEAALDLSYKRRELEEAQITVFSNPTAFNDIGVDEYAVGVRYGALNADEPFFIRVAYRRANRTGLIEFLPDAEDEVDEFQFEAAFRNDQTFYSGTVVHQNIELKIANPYERNRDIVAGRVVHYANGFQAFGGIAYDRETYGPSESRKYDLYAGGERRHGFLDYGGQVTYFVSEITTDGSRENSQGRFEGLFRLRSSRGDNWRGALQLLASYDTALDGLDAFENSRIGAEAIWRPKFVGDGVQPALLVSLRFDHQEFFNIDDSTDTFLARLAIGLGS